MKRGLTIIAVIGVLLLVALVISLAVVASLSKSCKNSTLEPASAVKNEEAICLTPTCIHIASRILDNMNPEVKPCDDFYEFACGGFVKSARIPDDEVMIDTFSMVEDKLQEQLKTSIEEPSSPGELRPFTLAKNVYRSCMNTSAIEAAGLNPLHEVLRQLGGWPVVEGDNWKEDKFNWIESVYKLRHLGYSLNYFLGFGIIVEWQNGTKNTLVLDQATLGISQKYLAIGMENDIVKAYFDYMVDIAVMLGADKERATKELMESLEFEMNLANISLPEEKRRDFALLNNPMTIAELKNRFPSINWKEYINNLLPPTVQVDDNEVVMVVEPGFIRGLEQVLENTTRRAQANYLMWRVAGASVNYLSEEIRKRKLDYEAALGGKTESYARWKECLAILTETMPIGTGALYVRKYFKPDIKKNAVEMVGIIRKEFREILKKAEWMDEQTRNRALEKAASISSHIAYPDELLDDKKLTEYYAPVELNSNDFPSIIRNLSLFQTKYSLEKLKKPVNKSDWTSHGNPAEVNAFYAVTENSIQLPAGILQGTFFSKDRPRYLNYGVIGFVIGHEITHGFDNSGRQFDKNGNLVDWWAPETKEKFLEKTECIVHQYGNYTVESVGQNLNGLNTLGENIADNGGIKVAYLAHKESVKRNGPEPKLPGLNYTSEQMFWIGAANTWCIKNRVEAMKHHLIVQTHSPGQFRVLGPFKNMPEFSADFDCPLGSGMNPEQKCSVW